MSAWLPTGKLKDGTLLFGPLKDKPDDDDPIMSVMVDGVNYWVKYCCPELDDCQKAEVKDWSAIMISKWREEGKL